MRDNDFRLYIKLTHAFMVSFVDRSAPRPTQFTQECEVARRVYDAVRSIGDRSTQFDNEFNPPSHRKLKTA